MHKKLFTLAIALVMTMMLSISVAAQDNVVVEFWTTDNEEVRVDTYEAVAAEFMAENPGIEVRIVPIDEATLSQRVLSTKI